MLTDIFEENVDHHVAEIHENPLCRRGSFRAEGRMPLGGKDSIDMICDSPHLALRISGAQDGAQDQIIGN
jgi:hypothetical protein